MKTKDVKVKKVLLGSSGSVNVIITLPNGAIFDVSFDKYCDDVLIHHTTTIETIKLRGLRDVSVVKELNENGSVRDIKFQ